MKRWIVILGLAGAVWMMFVIYSGKPFLALVTNYPGMFAARLVRHRGLGPSSLVFWMFNAWLVLTSALEWIAVGLLGRAIVQRLAR